MSDERYGGLESFSLALSPPDSYCLPYPSKHKRLKQKLGKKGRKKRRHKHQWRKVGATYSKESGLTKIKKRCIVPGCGATKEV